MARPERYDSEQWQSMNQPESQQRIRELLGKYLSSFLDSAPEGGDISRVLEVFAMLTEHFERDLQLAEEDPKAALEPASTYSIAKLVLMCLASAGSILVKMDRIENRADSADSTVRTWQTISQEEQDAEAIQKLKEQQEQQQGKEHWWE